MIPKPEPLTPPRIVEITTPFDTAHAKRLLAPGRNTLHGSALLRQQGGRVVTCAGTPVILIPATAYARERMQAYYGSQVHGATPNEGIVVRSPNADPAAWVRLQRSTLCDPQGYFTFQQVADGDFFVLVAVEWVVAGEQQGREMLQGISLNGGETATPVITWP
jgi:hypothetical protein